MGEDKVKFQPRTGSVAPLDALNLLIGRMQVLGIEATFIDGRKSISIATLRKRVETKGTRGHLETDRLSLQYGVAGSYDHCFVSIREKVANAAGEWDTPATPFVGLDGFVEGGQMLNTTTGKTRRTQLSMNLLVVTSRTCR
ncbi:hypothetical protein [Paraburkholderia sp. J69-2]|uniref:hypothetical protein n=1 Tax=Paraburkholderia sp. J69-2 TaxID=2805437 RepID=UPI002AB28E33|nr:hypothetical protein [Paraburkholderia sp. J69-2]